MVDGWHIGFCVRSMSCSELGGVALYYDRSVGAYQYCYTKKKGSSNYNSYESRVVLFFKDCKSLEANDFIPLFEITTKGNPTDFYLKEKDCHHSVWSGEIYYKGDKVQLLRQEQVLLEMYGEQYFLSKQKAQMKSAPFSEYRLENKYKELKAIVSSYNIEEIINGIEVNIEEHFYHKIGGDDRYTATQVTTTSYPVDKLDDFLLKHFQIGCIVIAENSGYCTAESMKDPNIVAGKLSPIALEQHKARLMASYSSKNHCEYLLGKYMSNLGNQIEKTIDYFSRVQYQRFEHSFIYKIALGNKLCDQLSFIDKKAKRDPVVIDGLFEKINKRAADIYRQFEAITS